MNPFASFEVAESQSRTAELKRKVREAIAWGIPDRESTGLSQQEFVRLLSQLLRYCEWLEGKLPR